MSDDIGPGDVVEAVRNLRRAFSDKIVVPSGTRDVVLFVTTDCESCVTCGNTGFGLELSRCNPGAGRFWCPCAWRKIGPSRNEVARILAEDLNVPPVRPRVDA